MLFQCRTSILTQTKGVSPFFGYLGNVLFFVSVSVLNEAFE